jgi:transcription termination factor Rho
MSGGIDARAMEIPETFLRCAQYREAGSLTIVATRLIETGSRWMN